MNAKATKLTGKRLLTLLVTLALSVMMVPAAAFAEGDAPADPNRDKNECVQAVADGVDESATIGNIAVTDGKPGIIADAANDGRATVRAGSVNSSEHNGINADAHGASSTVTVGNVTSGHDNGVQARADEGGTVTVRAGNISSGENGTGIWTSAKDSASGEGSTVTVRAGNVNAEGEGIVARPEPKSTITIEVGDVRARGDGVQIVADEGGKVLITATNITAGESGLFISAGATSEIEVLVTGTLTGGRAPVAYYGALPENFKLTVWKVNLDDTSMSEAERAELFALMKAAGIDVEADKEGRWNPYPAGGLGDALGRSINYIMKLGQSEGATLSATDADGKPLSTSNGYSVAHEGERVMLKVDLEEGCELVAAYDGSGNKVELVQASDGSYYIAYTVPNGGGLGLSVEVTKPLAETAIEAIENALASNSPASGVFASGALAKAIAANEGSPLPRTGDDLPAAPFALLSLLAAAMLALAHSKCRATRTTGRHVAR